MVHRVDKVTTLTKFPGTLAHYQDLIIDVFARAIPAKKFEVYLFGSRARGDEERVPMPTLP